jgi:hypothetical protein
MNLTDRFFFTPLAPVQDNIGTTKLRDTPVDAKLRDMTPDAAVLQWFLEQSKQYGRRKITPVDTLWSGC